MVGGRGFTLLLSDDTNDKHLYHRWRLKSVFAWWMTVLSTELELSINIQSYPTCDTEKSSKHW